MKNLLMTKPPPAGTAAAMTPVFRPIVRVRNELKDTFTLELEVTDGGPGSPFEPGQFNMLYAFGVGELPISISGDPATPNQLLHTIRVVGNLTQAIARLKPGDAIGVRGPFGTGWPMVAAERKDVVIVAGGIGLASLRPVIYRLLANREHYGRVVVLYGARSPADILFRAELEAWRGRFDIEVRTTVDMATREWHGEVGVVSKLVPKAQFNPAATVAMVGGPEVIMRYAVNELRGCGMKSEQIYVSLERNMNCGIGLCGHCQLGPTFVCKDGPVFRYDQVRELINMRGI